MVASSRSFCLIGETRWKKHTSSERAVKEANGYQAGKADVRAEKAREARDPSQRSSGRVSPRLGHLIWTLKDEKELIMETLSVGVALGHGGAGGGGGVLGDGLGCRVRSGPGRTVLRGHVEGL